MAFQEVRFPTNISRGARGGPMRKVQIVALGSGDEERNASWLNSRRRYDVAYGVRKADDLAAVVAFFEARAGQLDGFRFKDWSDYDSTLPSLARTSLDQNIGTGNGAQTTFQLVKRYTSGAQTWVRTITKPVAGTVQVTATIPQGPELVVDWNNPATSNWTNDAATGAVSGATLAGFLSAYEIGVTGAGQRRKGGGSIAALVAGTKYRVQGWFRGGTGTTAALRIRCMPGTLDCVIAGPFSAPVITIIDGGAISNVVATDLGGGNWTWAFDVVIGAGLTGAMVGIGNTVSGQSVILFGGSIRTPASSALQSGVVVDFATGLVTLTGAPGVGTVITAGFEFDVPVRFDSDTIDVSLSIERAGSITSIPLIEVRR